MTIHHEVYQAELFDGPFVSGCGVAPCCGQRECTCQQQQDSFFVGPIFEERDLFEQQGNSVALSKDMQ
jgi:hypothetical protein